MGTRAKSCFSATAIGSPWPTLARRPLAVGCRGVRGMSSRGSGPQPNLILSTRKAHKAPFVRAGFQLSRPPRETQVDYRYGSGPDEVDAFFKAKKPWSKVKDKI